MHKNIANTIMVVDDTPKNLTLLTAILERRKYRVITAPDGVAALKMFYDDMPDLVLLDIMMPKMDGFEVCRQLKDDKRSADIPVIFISALDDTQDIIRAFDVGGVDYVTKPFKSREVLKRVESHLTLLRQRRQLEAIRSEERAQFERINAMREQFIRSATHDLKNPLSLITGYTSLMELLEPVQTSDDLQEYIQLIRYGSNRMRALVQDMLDLIQLQSGDGKFNPQVASLEDILQQIVMESEVAAGDKDIALHYEAPDETIPILIDRHLMRKVFHELLSNALKFSNAGDSVTVSVKNDLNRVSVTIADTGIGIPEDHQEEILQPFFRVPGKAHQEQEGHGLGLSTAQAIIAQHGGNLTITSTEGEGSQFTVHLSL